MKDSTDFVQLVVNAADAIGGSAKIDPRDNWASLVPFLPRLVSETVPVLPKLIELLERMDESTRDQILSELGTRGLQRGKGEMASGITLLILYILLLAYDLHKDTVYTLEKADIDVIDPPKDYWFQRVDGKGSHRFFDDGIYLVNSIPPAGTSTYFNSEIYNSPYTSLRPKNVVINTGLVDDPLTEPALFLYDLFLNKPYVAKNGTIFSSRVKATNLEGGSRGWGFWNTSSSLGMQIAWFIQFNGFQADGAPYPLNGFWAQTQNGLAISMVPLPALDEGWHDYRIEMSAESVEYFVDNRSVAKVTDDSIPTSPMAFHNWVDNAVFEVANFSVEHVMQQTTEPRTNTTEIMRIYSGPIDRKL
jgi:hypothetical protein